MKLQVLSSIKSVAVSIGNDRVLLAILALAFLLRIAGIGYGLPLTVVSDETPFTLGALLMIQLHTLVPAFHPAAFMTVLPYPPYISYVLLLPFVLILGAQYLMFGGGTLFQAHVLSDLSAFFLTARMANIILGLVSIYLIYRIAEAIFRSRIAARAASFLLTTSVIHQALSMVGRNWMPTMLILLFVFYALTRTEWSLRRRYIAAFIAVGIGMGISSFALFGLVGIGLYYILFDLTSLKGIARDSFCMLPGAVSFLILAVLPALLYQSGNAFLRNVTLFDQKSLTDLLASPWTALSQSAFSEPVLIGLFLIGILFLFRRHIRIAVYVVGYIVLYAIAFYVFFRFEPRFMLPLIPLYALVGGYCVAQLWNRRTAVVLCIFLVIPLVSAFRVSQLAYQGDTRLAAREWALANLTPRDKVLVYADNTRFPMTKAGVAELRAIEEGAVRKTDVADETLDRIDIPYALNLFTLRNNLAFLGSIPEYAKQNNYDYLVLEPAYTSDATSTASAFMLLTKDATLVREFRGSGHTTSIADSSFKDPLTRLFTNTSFGPDIVVYRLR